MRCSAARKKLEGYLAGVLVGHARGALDRHIASCAGCQAELAKARRVWQSLESDERFDPGPEFNRRVWARIERSTLPARAGTFGRLRPALALAGAMAAAVLLGGVTGREIAQFGYAGARDAGEWPVAMFDRVPLDSLGGTYAELATGSGGDAR